MTSPTESSGAPKRETGRSPLGSWRLHLLGTPSLTDGGAPLSLPSTAALALAYVALEGQVPRAVLCALLWPGSAEATARNNLRELKRRLRLARGGFDVLEGEESLQFSGHVDVDALRLKNAPLSESTAEGELLAGLRADGGPARHPRAQAGGNGRGGAPAGSDRGPVRPGRRAAHRGRPA